MNNSITTYTIGDLSGNTKSNQDVLFIDHQIDTQNLAFNTPYRSNYYGVGICLKGKATFKGNLETYEINENCIITTSPQIVKQWVSRSDDYYSIVVFFTKEYFIQYNSNKNYLDSFPFFEANAKHLSKFTAEQAEIIVSLLKKIQQYLNSLHPYKNEIIRNLISILLCEIAVVKNQESLLTFHKQTRNEQLTADFKKLASESFIKERSVHFYAEQLFISAKHLTEIVKSETGKSAKEWIEELVILEAKILLQDASLTISNIADDLNFADQSIFGKFFKNATGLSPIAYRQSL
jgi:AraC family transcriptional regulator, transcriptional activator of pobA